ncbi:MAG: tRNA (guanosine(46)-N7)-methyltransferase TrmB [Clostridiales bacterium]|nr:tRNA (guanosine(46)-N7)-methyltransferase TrmB [Clostridiales bacterium]
MRLRNIPEAKTEVLESAFVVQDPQAWKGRWSQVFANENQMLHLEVEMGKGRFLMDMARLHPEINYVGIEMYDSVLLRALQKRAQLEEQGVRLDNLYFLRVDARNLPDFFGEGEVDRIYLNFSDPWPKARHAKRRLTSGEFLERYAKILRPEGTVEFKTDNRELFDFSLEEAGRKGWPVLECTFDLHSDGELSRGNVMTEYEEKFSALGNPICKMILALPVKS